MNRFILALPADCVKPARVEFQIRMTSRIFTGFGLLLLLISATGCSTTTTSGSYSLNGPLPQKLSHFKTAIVEVRSAIEKPPKNQEKFMAFLEARIIEELRERRVFETVSPREPSITPDGLCIVVTLTKIREPNAAASFFVGLMAGVATAKATVEFKEQPGDRLIGGGQAEGISSGTLEWDVTEAYLYKGTAAEAVPALAKRVVKLIVDHL